jgi:PAS domain-containing protein
MANIDRMQKKNDPFINLLQPTKQFADQQQYESYLKALNAALSWLDNEPFAVVVADALVTDFPIVAASNKFLQETGYSRSEVLYTNCRFLVDNVSYPDVFRISRSARTALKSYCQLARFPGALNSPNCMQVTQPNALRDGSVVINDFAVVRTYVAGHPLLIGVQKFSPIKQHGARSSPEEWDEIEDYLQQITKHILADENLGKMLGSQIEVRTTGPKGLYHGPCTSSYLLFYQGGFGVLRQEPQTIPHSGVIVTAEPLTRHAGGFLRYSLRVETLSDWEGDFPMGFTKTLPGSHFPKKLQFSPEHVGFTSIGAVCNPCKESIAPNEAGISTLQQWQVDPLPPLKCGDVVSVELNDNGNLSRYLNGKLMCTVATGIKPQGVWYGAFEVSMSVSRVCLLDDDAFPADSAVADNPQSLLTQPETKNITDILSVLETDQLSITFAINDEDMPLVYVTQGFEVLTGFKSKDIIGRNCRFLNQDLGLSSEHRMGILQACYTGSHFLSVLQNQRMDGTLFHNLLDLRTLEIGRYVDDGTPARLLVGIQGEVDEGRTVDHWMLDLPDIVSETLQKVTAAIHKDGLDFQIHFGDERFLTPIEKPFWVEEQSSLIAPPLM